MSTVRWAPKNAKTHEASLSENMAQELNERLAAGSPIRIPPRPTASIQPKRRVSAPRAVVYDIAAGVAAPVVHAAGLLARPISEDIGNSLIDTATGWRLNAQDRMTDRSPITHAAALIGGLLVPDATDAIRVSKAIKKVVDKLDDVIDAIPPKVGPRGVMTPPARVAPSGLVPPVAPIRPIEAAPPRSRWPLSLYAEDYVQMPSPTVGPIRNSLRLSDADYQRLVGKPLGINEMLGSDQIVANKFLTPVEQRMAQWLASRAQPRPGTELVYVPTRPAPLPDPPKLLPPPPSRKLLEVDTPTAAAFNKAAKRKATIAKNRADFIQGQEAKAEQIFAENEAAYQASVLADAEAAATAKHKAARQVIDEAAARTKAYQEAASARTRKEMAQRRAEELAKELDAKVQLEVEAINKAEDEAKLVELNRYADRVNRAEEVYRAGRATEYRELFGPRHDVAFGPRRAAEAKVARAAKAEAKAAKAEAKAAEAAEPPRSFWQKKRGKALKWGLAGWGAVGGTAAATQWFTPAARVYQQRLDDAEANKLSAEVDYLKQPWNKQYRDAYTKASAELKQAKDMSYFWSNVGQGLLKVPMGPLGYAKYADQLGDHERDRAAISELQTEVDNARGAFVTNATAVLGTHLNRASQEVVSATEGRPRLTSLITPTAVNNKQTQVFREFANQYSNTDSGLWEQLRAKVKEDYGVDLNSFIERQY